MKHIFIINKVEKQMTRKTQGELYAFFFLLKS